MTDPSRFSTAAEATADAGRPAMQQWIVVLRPTRAAMLTEGPTPGEAEAVQAHFEHFRRQCDSGRLLLAGRTQTADERTMGIALLAAISEAEARAIVDQDPAVEAGVMTAELLPFRVAIRSSEGWERL